MPKNRSSHHPKLDATLDELNRRLASAQTEVKRISARRAATKSKLEAIGKHLANLEAELREVSPPAKARGASGSD